MSTIRTLATQLRDMRAARAAMTRQIDTVNTKLASKMGKKDAVDLGTLALSRKTVSVPPRMVPGYSYQIVNVKTKGK